MVRMILYFSFIPQYFAACLFRPVAFSSYPSFVFSKSIHTRTATTTDNGRATDTYLLFANNFSSPSVGRTAAALADPNAREYGLDGSFTVDNSMFTTYREIQFSIIQEITSFTLQYAFRIPETAARAAATTIAASTHTYHGILNPSAKYRHAPAPATYCPAAPMLNSPTL